MSSKRDLIPFDADDRVVHIQPRGGVSAQTNLPQGRAIKLSFIARMKHGKEINDHVLTLLRQDHITIEANAAKEAVALTLLNGGRIRLQAAHHGGLLIREYGPDSGAYEIAPLIAQAMYDRVDSALEDIEQIFVDNTKANMRRR